MPAPIIPFEPCNFPEEIQTELDSRKKNRSFNYISSNKGEWNSDSGDWTKYKGPRTPWTRLCSNGRGRISGSNGQPFPSNKIKEGFILFSGKDFYSGYGFNNLEGSPSVIGYVPNKSGGVHTIDNDLNTSNFPIHVPPPEIEKIEITIQKELYRRVSIDWVCFSKAQLEYMTPYFLIPGITCILEWGWNHYDPASLLDLTNTSKLKQIFNNPYSLYTENILKSKGNYDVIFGIITHFEWFIDGNKIKCKTEITSKDRIYAGLLTNSNIVSKNKEKRATNDPEDIPLSSLTKFIKELLPKFKEVSSAKDLSAVPSPIPLLSEFIDYIKIKQPNNWKEYVYGVFYGRDMQDINSPLQLGANRKTDFDYVSKNKELWINLGLAIEIINFHSAPLKGMKGKEMFRVDIDDVVIGGHPNMISTDGSVCLIPNAEAPKYFYGLYGYNSVVTTFDGSPSDYDVLKNSTNAPGKVLKRTDAIKNNTLFDYRVREICQPLGNGIYRDDLDEIINHIRYENNSDTSISFEFPFFYRREFGSGSIPYPAKYSGYLKNIYVNVEFLQTLLVNNSIKTYFEFTEKILEGISNACGNFWDFRLVNSTGKDGQNINELAAMKIVDYKFMATSNKGKIYTFDYYDADGLLLGLSFKPTISNAQAIRSIYASTNNPNRLNTITNGTNELLDYHFEDRLLSEDQDNDTVPIKKDTSGFKDSMRQLQQINPLKGSYQITNVEGGSTIVTKIVLPKPITLAQPSPYSSLVNIQNQIDKQKAIDNAAASASQEGGKIIVRRLVLPDPEILQFLLDDGDEENNPKYTGIMPGIQATIKIQGIGGLRTFMMFLIRNLPEPYSHLNIVFRIVDVQEEIVAGNWITSITAGVIPLRDYIKKRLGINPKSN